MPIEIYIAILVACSCIVLLTVSFLVAAVYFTARVSSIERQVTRKATGKRTTLEEIAVYTVKNDLITREAFFFGGEDW